ncbi:6-phosphogluconolactonase [Nakamurella panacisegetis]|uniref:6-phosphogluconolactonase n=1 Tax=Nakamurella panacisegetis TaxID=1090615 RepID=A0A1H0SHE2_9ACTN|nr:6-phosphogluconolactonase [Nakamurella panacisegetis]SDP41095.1 6-phosphogluconolactonase [Nakamurella panacisegetis]
MTGVEVVVHRDTTDLNVSTAARLAAKLVQIQAQGRVPRIALTGGGSGIGLLAELNASPAKDDIDFSRIEFYWGDERFVPGQDPERNEKQARDALLDHVRVDPAKVHPMAASDGEFGDDVDRAAAAYAAVVGDDPAFDVVMLGMGPEGHVASIFPESPAVFEQAATVVAVRDCPKPPPTRMSLTLPAIRRADEVWIITGGDGKADAVHRALSGAGEVELPVAGATGRTRTLFLLDRGSAARLPAGQSGVTFTA